MRFAEHLTLSKLNILKSEFDFKVEGFIYQSAAVSGGFGFTFHFEYRYCAPVIALHTSFFLSMFIYAYFLLHKITPKKIFCNHTLQTYG